MARMGVFSRQDDRPEPIPRSLQLLSHRNTFDARYMEIYPNFAGILYPNESISLQVTNFVRSIPMKRPMMTRVRVYQSFVAVPLRIMWSAWEDYIKGENDAEFLYEEPYIVNATDGAETNQVTGIGQAGISFDGGFAKLITASGAVVTDASTPTDETTVTGSPKFRGVLLDRNSYVSARLLGGDTTASYRGDDTRKCYMKVGVHELGDYFNHPLYVSSGKNFIQGYGSVEEPFSAFKFCAYQLAYSYFERSVNVQTRQDDFYEMSQESCHDFPSIVACVNPSNEPVPPFTYTYNSKRFNVPVIRKAKTVSQGVVTAVEEPRDVTLGTSRGDKLRTCWEFVEKFPLKSGPNLSMLASQPNQVTGLPEYVSSNISLTRKRFANWQTDYFTSCNPWQQRGDEVQIPVNGSVAVSLSGVTFSFTGSTISVPPHPANIVFEDSSGSDIGHSNQVLVFEPTSDSSNNLIHFDHISGYSNSFIDGYSHSDVFQGRLSVPSFNADVALSATSSASGTATAVPSLYVSPSQFRFAMTLQHIKEAQASIDNRYQSYIRKFFGARARDYRLDRPEFLGGSVMELNVADVTQTSQSTNDSLLGDLAGKS